MTIIKLADHRKPPPIIMSRSAYGEEDQEVRAEVLLARIAWLEEVIENQWKQIVILRKLKGERDENTN